MLSILIPTIPERSDRLKVLYYELMRQKADFDKFHYTLGKIEILINDDKRFLEGGLSIGKKREKLVQSASGKYLCFLDDDEQIAPNYIETLMRLCYEGNDINTFRAFVRLENMWGLVNMSLDNLENEQLHPNRS